MTQINLYVTKRIFEFDDIECLDTKYIKSDINKMHKVNNMNLKFHC